MDTQSNVIAGIPHRISLPTSSCIGQLVFNQLKLHGNKVAEIQLNTGEEITFKEILETSCKLAIYLKQQGLLPGDRIAVCSENNIRFCIPVFAGFFNGAAICPMNPSYSLNELRHALDISRPKFMFASPLVVKLLQDVVKTLQWPMKLIMLSPTPGIELPSISSVTNDVQMAEVNLFQPFPANVDDVVAILCSSGTTGLSKGVELTNSNILAAMQILANPSLGYTRKNVVDLAFLPFFHTFAFHFLLTWLIIGSKVVVMSRFVDKDFLEAIEKYRIQILLLVPPIAIFLAKSPLVGQHDLSSVNCVLCGAASLSRDMEEILKTRLNLNNILQGYGLTETAIGVLCNIHDKNKPGSIGVVMPGILAKIIEIRSDHRDFGKSLGPNTKGEICFKGDTIMKGYRGDVSSTKAAIDDDGWLHTGDVGYYDEDGFFYIVDRLKELIKYKGFQVPPAELEAVLLTHPAIKDAAVIGVPDLEAGELPLAIIVKQPGVEITSEDVTKYVNDRVSNQKKIRGGVCFVDEIPKTASGKILRRELRKMLKIDSI